LTNRVWPLNLLEEAARNEEMVEVRLKDGFIIRGKLVHVSKRWGEMILDNRIWINGHYVFLVRFVRRTYVGKE